MEDEPAAAALVPTAAPRVMGRIQEYDPQVESITTYLERLQLYFVANGVEVARRVPVLLTLIGAKVYGTLRSLLAPALPQDKDLRSGTKVYSDSWAAYRGVQQLSAVVQHQMVNHSLNFVHPVTGVHTQNVESYWNRVKTKFKRMKGVHHDMLTSYMDEFMWRERHGGSSAPTVMASICRDISLRYPQ